MSDIAHRVYDPLMTTADQIRAARALLRLDQTDLARRADVSVATLRRLEAREPVSSAVVARVTAALEATGAEFIPQGVRRKDAPSEDFAACKDRLMAIARVSAQRQARHPTLSEADLYDENGLPS